MTPDRFSELRILRWTDRINEILAGEQRGPIRASLDLTNVCNHACPWCEPLAYREESMRDRNHTLRASLAIETLDELAEFGCKTINFSGGGEPTCHPYFGGILKHAAQLKMRTWVVTNGQLMHKWFDGLLLADHIRISLDASNALEHKQMHASHGDDFEKVCENIVELCKRRTTAAPEVGIAYIVADCNSSGESIRRLLEFADSAHVNFVHFRPLSEQTPTRFTEPWIQVASTIERIAKDFIAVDVFPLAKRGSDVFLQREFESCYSALTNAVIGANGDIQACCDQRGIVFGNINQQSFRSIWLGAKHREIAAKINPKLCTLCLQCGFNRSVEKYVVHNAALPELV